jgi:hypothetical protein
MLFFRCLSVDAERCVVVVATFNADNNYQKLEG